MAARLSPSGWLSGPAFDLGLMIGPTLLACAVAAALPDAVGLSAVGWLLLVVFIDVGHVWATGLRLATDRSPGHLRRALLLPLAVAIALIGVQLVVPHWYWRGMALLAIFHFLRQQVGIAMVYRHAAGLPPGPDARWERAAHWAAAGVPMLYWLSHLPRRFVWFVEGDLPEGLPTLAFWIGAAAGAVAWLGHGRNRWRSRSWSWGRDLWLLSGALAWWTGVVWRDDDLVFSLTNIVAHGVPYVALVALVESRRSARGGASALPAALWRGPGLALVLLALLTLAFTEEALWDRFVWQEHAAIFGQSDLWRLIFDGVSGVANPEPGWAAREDGAWTPADRAVGLAVALLSVPQVTHYLLDGLIWRSRADPTLAALLRPEAPQQTAPAPPIGEAGPA